MGQEVPGILNWLIEDAKLWCAEGMRTPTVITRATDEYRGEMGLEQKRRSDGRYWQGLAIRAN